MTLDPNAFYSEGRTHGIHTNKAEHDCREYVVGICALRESGLLRDTARAVIGLIDDPILRSDGIALIAPENPKVEALRAALGRADEGAVPSEREPTLDPEYEGRLRAAMADAGWDAVDADRTIAFMADRLAPPAPSRAPGLLRERIATALPWALAYADDAGSTPDDWIGSEYVDRLATKIVDCLPSAALDRADEPGLREDACCYSLHEFEAVCPRTGQAFRLTSQPVTPTAATPAEEEGE